MRATGRLAGKILSGRVYPEILPLAPDERVVNLGCGSGPQAVVYKNRYRIMVGVDVNLRRLTTAVPDLAKYKVGREYQRVCGDVERVPLREGMFDTAIAVDIIEHVRNPALLCAEAHRLLRPGGLLLVTFPLQHDRFILAVRRSLDLVRRRNRPAAPEGWNPDAHNSAHGFAAWSGIIEAAGFRRLRWRATTLFPPLHLYGVPRFWFASDAIHRIDATCCRVPGLRRLGQTAMALYVRRE